MQIGFSAPTAQLLFLGRITDCSDLNGLPGDDDAYACDGNDNVGDEFDSADTFDSGDTVSRYGSEKEMARALEAKKKAGLNAKEVEKITALQAVGKKDFGNGVLGQDVMAACYLLSKKGKLGQLFKSKKWLTVDAVMDKGFVESQRSSVIRALTEMDLVLMDNNPKINFNNGTRFYFYDTELELLKKVLFK